MVSLYTKCACTDTLHIRANFFFCHYWSKLNATRLAALLLSTQGLFRWFYILFCSKTNAPHGITRTDYDHILYVYCFVNSCLFFFLSVIAWRKDVCRTTSLSPLHYTDQNWSIPLMFLMLSYFLWKKLRTNVTLSPWNKYVSNLRIYSDSKRRLRKYFYKYNLFLDFCLIPVWLLFT